MTLLDLDPHTEAQIATVTGEHKDRLYAIGICPGSTICKLSKYGQTPVRVCINQHDEFAFGSQFATHIIVTSP